MKRKSFYLLLCLLAISEVHANSCQLITNEINHDVIKYAGHLKNKNLSWMNFSWLKQQLGSANSSHANGNRTEYKWRCESEGSYLIAVVDNNGNLQRVNGQYNSDDGSGYFSAKIPSSVKQSETTTEPDLQTSPQSTPTSQLNATSLPENLLRYNEHYQTSFQNYVEVEDDMVNKIRVYYFSLRRCTEGAYEYPIPAFPDFLFHTAIISPAKDGVCPVKISYEIPHIGKIDLKCNYQPQSLILFTDEEAKITAHNGLKFDNENPSYIQTINKNECKRYVDGVL